MAKKFGLASASHEETLATLEEKGLKTASPYRRILAYVIDVVIAYLLSHYLMVSSSFGHLAFDELTGGNPAKYTFVFWSLVVMPFYYALCAVMVRRTIGCWLAGIDIILVTGERLGFLYAFLRGFTIGIITGFFFPILLILQTILALISYTRDPLRLIDWDMASRSIVVQKKNAEERSPIVAE